MKISTTRSATPEGTTSTQTRVWWGNDLYAGAFVLTACVLTLTYALLPAVGVEPLDQLSAL